MLITSKNNDTFKFLKSLKEKKYRQEHGLFMVEKPVVIEEARDFRPKYIAIKESIYKENKFAHITKKRIYLFFQTIFSKIFVMQ